MNSKVTTKIQLNAFYTKARIVIPDTELKTDWFPTKVNYSNQNGFFISVWFCKFPMYKKAKPVMFAVNDEEKVKDLILLN